MPVRLFNGECSRCNEFRPWCAMVYFRAACPSGKGHHYQHKAVVVCEMCRKKIPGSFRYAQPHKAK